MLIIYTYFSERSALICCPVPGLTIISVSISFVSEDDTKMVYPHNDNTNDTTRDNIMSSTIHFRIDDETKRLAMLAAERQQMSLTELIDSAQKSWQQKNSNFKTVIMSTGWSNR